jgi:hypothetical protein
VKPVAGQAAAENVVETGNAGRCLGQESGWLFHVEIGLRMTFADTSRLMSVQFDTKSH